MTLGPLAVGIVIFAIVAVLLGVAVKRLGDDDIIRNILLRKLKELKKGHSS